MNYIFNFRIITDNFVGLWHGVQITLLLSTASMGMAFILALPVALGRLSAHRIFSIPAGAYVEFIRNTPLLVQLVWIYYCMPIIIGVNLPALSAAILGLSVSESAVIAEVMRAGIQAVPRGHVEAAQAVGFSRLQTLRRIVLPQALRMMIPPLLNAYVSLLKATALVAIIAIPDLMFAAQRISSETFRPIEILTATAFIYFGLAYPIVLFVRWLERRGQRVLS